MEWEPVYLSLFRCENHGESHEKKIQDVLSTDFFEEDNALGGFIEGLVSSMVKKKASLVPQALCRAFQFAEDSEGESDRRICDQLLHAVSLSAFSSHAQILATKYAKSPRAREGLFFVLNANVVLSKSMSPVLAVFKTDFQPGIIPEGSELAFHSNLILPNLKKGLFYPYHDGYRFHVDRVKLFQSSTSDYFQRLLQLQSLPDREEIIDDALKTELEERNPDAYSKYFEAPVQTRSKKREVFGPTRKIADVDLLSPDRVVVLNHKTQERVAQDQDYPIRLRLKIDESLQFEGRVDQMNRNFYFAQEGLEKFLIIRGTKFETGSHFQSVEFMELESLDEALNRILGPEKGGSKPESS
jgi:hypothetical protein